MATHTHSRANRAGAAPLHAESRAPTSEAAPETFRSPTSAAPAYAIEYEDGGSDHYGHGVPEFAIAVRARPEFDRLLALDDYSLAMAFVRGDFAVEGDLVAAVRFFRARSRSPITGSLAAAIGRIGFAQVGSWFRTKKRAAENIRFHYDQSNDFYRNFLDSRMVYSCAYFEGPGDSLDSAQLRKLDHICRKLDLQPGDAFLDVGSGWGGLIIHAAERYGANSAGCTLSRKQFDLAREKIRALGLGESVRVELRDYRDVQGAFDKIASVGMFEHVGRRRSNEYFRKLFLLLRPGGLLLNHAIMRPAGARDTVETVFIRHKVFPGGELPYLSDVIRSAERSGFEVLDVENLRPHYALTCRAWVKRLQQNGAECLGHVDRSRFRTWLLLFAASAARFEDGLLNVNQVLLYKPGNDRARPFTREYMYR
ncbi:MAG TPA: cyclopropane-fatty-acyl-phospholipid synthase family protein [Candidatus Cybelea sp.]|nr:cyclopropane-fatty-acyl-phospholipid synthase family protein [Candidatus Cybelea sp.]